jgi:hypothetical protein
MKISFQRNRKQLNDHLFEALLAGNLASAISRAWE